MQPSIPHLKDRTGWDRAGDELKNILNYHMYLYYAHNTFSFPWTCPLFFLICNIWACDYLMVCFRYITVNILHKDGDNDFDKLVATAS